MDKWGFALRLIGMGWYVASAILLGTLGGLWLDNKFNTKPILALVGVLAGTFMAFYGLYRLLLPGIEREQKGRKGKN